MNVIFPGPIDDRFEHIRNRQILDAVDNVEAFTPPAFVAPPVRRTAKETIADCLSASWLDLLSGTASEECAAEIVAKLRAAGYDIIQRVSQGNKHD